MRIDLPKYEDKRELFAYLKKHSAEIIALKKAETKHCDAFGASVFEKNVVKSIVKNYDGFQDSEDVIRRTIVGNTYNWMDKHEDVHIDGIFTRSIQNNKSRILHLHDHLQQVGAKVGIPANVYEEKTDWAALGINRVGQTTCLCMDSDIKKYLNESIFYQYKNREIDQHSVGMVYVTILLCMDSEDKENKDEKANWLKYFPRIGNPDRAMKTGYFFAVTEAKLIEISAVTEGSNELTPTKQLEPASGTSEKSGPAAATLNWDHFKQLNFNNK